MDEQTRDDMQTEVGADTERAGSTAQDTGAEPQMGMPDTGDQGDHEGPDHEGHDHEGHDHDHGRADGDDAADVEEKQQSADQFAQEHDPAQHDIAAGEEFRQRGDWTADEAGGTQKWDADGNLVEGTSPGVTSASAGGSSDANDSGDASGSDDSPDAQEEPDTGTGGGSASSGRRTSGLEEIRDGGYGVGSAAVLDDAAMPLGHGVKAWEDTKTFVTPEHDRYGDAEPHVWFVDAESAQRAGFRAVD